MARQAAAPVESGRRWTLQWSSVHAARIQPSRIANGLLIAWLPLSRVQWLANLNGGRVAGSTEVVVAPPTVFLETVRSGLRKDFAVAAQVRQPAISTRPRARCVSHATADPPAPATAPPAGCLPHDGRPHG